jgi:hypothetical protein
MAGNNAARETRAKAKRVNDESESESAAEEGDQRSENFVDAVDEQQAEDAQGERNAPDEAIVDSGSKHDRMLELLRVIEKEALCCNKGRVAVSRGGQKTIAECIDKLRNMVNALGASGTDAGTQTVTTACSASTQTSDTCDQSKDRKKRKKKKRKKKKKTASAQSVQAVPAEDAVRAEADATPQEAPTYAVRAKAAKTTAKEAGPKATTSRVVSGTNSSATVSSCCRQSSTATTTASSTAGAATAPTEAWVTVQSKRDKAQERKAKAAKKHAKRYVQAGNYPMLVVSNASNSAEEIIRGISKIPLSAINGPARSVVPTSSGKVVIKTTDPKQRELLKQEIGKIDGVSISDGKKPTVIVRGVVNAIDEASVVCCLNRLNPEISDFKAVAIRKGINPRRRDIILEASKASCSAATAAGEVILGLTAYRVEEHVAVLQCFQCLRFGHKSTACRHKERCKRCGGAHVAKECTAQTSKCVNCVDARLPGTAHSATSSSCPVFKRRMAEKKQWVS